MKVWSPMSRAAGSQMSQGQMSFEFGHVEVIGDFSKISVRRGIHLKGTEGKWAGQEVEATHDSSLAGRDDEWCPGGCSVL